MVLVGVFALKCQSGSLVPVSSTTNKGTEQQTLSPYSKHIVIPANQPYELLVDFVR